jgi:hypothetical protein
MDILSLLVQLASGAAGGNAAGGALKKISLGPAGNALAGAIGGLLGGQVLGPGLNAVLSGGASSLDPLTIIANVVSGGAGGGILMAVVGLVKSLVSKAS